VLNSGEPVEFMGEFFWYLDDALEWANLHF
jgi:hypothetical protein